MNRVRSYMGRRIAHFLQKEATNYAAFSVIPQTLLRATLRPGDVLLVEGNSRISAAIKYLTHSTWSHAALYIGAGDGRDLIEADLEEGVRWAPLTTYRQFNTRICRPVSLSEADLARVLAFMQDSIGKTYDLRNVVDLARYLLPQPPVPRRFRRRMLAIGSGDPTRAICSTLIAEAFQLVRYPVLPEIRMEGDEMAARDVLHIRHHSLFTPRDFDLSPYFAVVKPTIAMGFDYRKLTWYGDASVVTAPPEAPARAAG